MLFRSNPVNIKDAPKQAREITALPVMGVLFIWEENMKVKEIEKPKEYIVTDDSGEVLAVITKDQIIEKDGIQVIVQ